MYQLSQKLFGLYICCALLCCFQNSAYSQSLNIYSVQSDKIPVISASLSIRNQNNVQLSSIIPSDIRVVENGINRNVRLIECPSERIIERISSVLVMDISGSMAVGDPTNMALAKIAGKWWIQSQANDGSECAVTSFDHNSYINQDFTNNKQKLIDAINNLSPSGGTDYNSGFISGIGAGLKIISRAKHKRILIFLTDGQGGVDADAVLQAAQKEQVTVFCVGVRFSLPDALKNIAEKTNGLWFENVLSETQLIDAYKYIYDIAVNNVPCRIEWDSDVSCTNERTAIVSYNALGVSDTIVYNIPDEYLPTITFSDLIVKFATTSPGNTDSKSVEITAMSNNVEINNITVNNNVFVINPSTPFPWKLQKGDTKSFAIQFTPQDSSLLFDQIIIQGNICKQSILYATGGFPGKRKKDIKITVKNPNGGERLIAGDTTFLEWSGVMPDDTVRLDYSTDDGQTWLSVINRTSGFSYAWKVPPTPSTQCLLRAQLVNIKSPDSVIVLIGHRNNVMEGCFSPDGVRAATVGLDSTLRIWDSFSGKQIVSSLPTRTMRRDFILPQTVAWSNSITHIAVGGNRGAVLFESDTYTPIRYFDDSPSSVNITSGVFTPDGLSYISTGMNNKIIISSVQQYGIYNEIPTSHTNTIHRLTIADFKKGTNGKTFTVLTASQDNSACNSEVSLVENDYSFNSSRQCYPIFSGGDSKVAYIQNPKNNGEQLVASINGRIIRYPDGATFTFPSNINDIEYSPDANYVAVAFNSGEIAILNASTMAIERRLDRIQATANSVRWDIFGSRIIATYTNGNALIWTLKDVVLQEDMSDNVWTIIVPQITTSSAIDMGALYVGNVKDSVCLNVLCMTPIPQYIGVLDSVELRNDNENNFRLVSGIKGDFSESNPSCRSIEVQFRPQSSGIKNAFLRFYVASQFYDIPLTGLGINQRVQLNNTVIDFGAISVGTSKDSIITPSLTNISSGPVEIFSTTIPDIGKEYFSILGGDTVITLSPQKFQTLNIRFTPEDIGRVSSRVRINFIGEGINPQQNYVYLFLIGEGICGRADSSKPLSINTGQKTMTVLTGRRLTIPLIVSYKDLQKEEIPREFFGKVSFNASLLYPRIGTPMGNVDKESKRRSIEFQGVRTNNSDTLIVFSFLTLFGDNDRTDFTVDTLFFKDGCPFIIRNDSLSIVFSDICEAGGKRLLTNARTTKLEVKEKDIHDNHILLSFALTEPSSPELLITNMIGDIIVRKNAGHLESGEYEYSIAVPPLASGYYYALLRTKNESVITTFLKW